MFEFDTEQVAATHVPGVDPVQVTVLVALEAVFAAKPALQAQAGPAVMSEFDTAQVAATHVPGVAPVQVTMLDGLEALFAE